MKKTNRRLTSIIIAAVIVIILVAIYVSGSFLPDSALRADFNQKFLSPSGTPSALTTSGEICS